MPERGIELPPIAGHSRNRSGPPIMVGQKITATQLRAIVKWAQNHETKNSLETNPTNISRKFEHLSQISETGESYQTMDMELGDMPVLPIDTLSQNTKTPNLNSSLFQSFDLRGNLGGGASTIRAEEEAIGLRHDNAREFIFGENH